MTTQEPSAGHGVSHVQADLLERLNNLTPAPPQFEMREHPRIVDGIVVPAVSLAQQTGAARAAIVYLPAGNVSTVGTTARAVGFTPKGGGRWVAIWIGDDREERDAVLQEFLAALADALRRRR